MLSNRHAKCQFSRLVLMTFLLTFLCACATHPVVTRDEIRASVVSGMPLADADGYLKNGGFELQYSRATEGMMLHRYVHTTHRALVAYHELVLVFEDDGVIDRVEFYEDATGM